MSKIRLTESQLHKAIKESVNKILNEGGNIYFKDDDGHIHTNSKDTWRGVPGTTYIWHGEWSDPEIVYKGIELNAEDVEEALWSSYEADCEEQGIKPTDSDFDEWCDKNPYQLKAELDDIIWSMN